MVHHIVLWNYAEKLSEPERKEAGRIIREKLEAAARVAQGICSLQVRTDGFPSGNRDVALLSSFESEEALKAWQVLPAHVEAGVYVRSVTCDRACFDYTDQYET